MDIISQYLPTLVVVAVIVMAAGYLSGFPFELAEQAIRALWGIVASRFGSNRRA